MDLWVRINRSTNCATIIGRHRSSVDSSVPLNLPSRVRVPSTPSMLLSIYIWIVSCRKDKNLQKEAGIGLFKKKLCPSNVCTVSKWNFASKNGIRISDEGTRTVSFLSKQLNGENDKLKVLGWQHISSFRYRRRKKVASSEAFFAATAIQLDMCDLINLCTECPLG